MWGEVIKRMNKSEELKYNNLGPGVLVRGNMAVLSSGRHCAWKSIICMQPAEGSCLKANQVVK